MRFILILCSLIAFLTACGGGNTVSVDSSPTNVAITGFVIDGYIEGATVCLDVNENSACDTTEPTAVTDSDGKYSISYSGSTTGLHILALVPTTAKDKDDGGQTLAQAGKTAFTLQAPAPSSSSSNTHLTPLSTMVSQEMISSGSNDAATVETQLKAQMGITTSMLNYDFKALTSTANTQSAALTVALTKAIAAAQTALATNAAFKTALGTSDVASINVAAEKGARNLVKNNLLPLMIDKTTGGLSSTITTSGIVTAATTVANANSSSLAVQANAPKAEEPTDQTFIDGLFFGSTSSGSYIDGSGNEIQYSKLLTFGEIKANPSTSVMTRIKKVLVGNTWVDDYDRGSSYYLTDLGWRKDKITTGTSSKTANGFCGESYNAEDNTALSHVCLTYKKLSGKKVRTLFLDVCIDKSGNSIPGCDPDTVFPINSYSYIMNISYIQDAYRLYVDLSWGGFGSIFNPTQTTLTGFLSKMKETGLGVTIGDDCKTSLKVKEFDPVLMKGVFIFGDSSAYSCSNYPDFSKIDFTETRPFTFKERAGNKVVIFQTPIIYAINNPRNYSKNQFLGTYENSIHRGDYYPVGESIIYGDDGFQKLGNKALISTYLNMIGAPIFPYLP